MATNNVDFRVKNGLVVQGTQGTIGGNPILTTASKLDHLQDVNLTGLQDTNVLSYSLATDEFIPLSTSTLQGPSGATGAQGTQGIQGVQGSVGPQGIQGLQGTTGAQGIQGRQGTTGSQGAQGTQGTQGLQGATGSGAQGTQGTQGLQGTQGILGTQGFSGAQGTNGTQGITGNQGIQGTIGIQGTQGIQGAIGIQGTQGLQGNTGGGLYTLSSTAPTGASAGDRWIDQDTGIEYTYLWDGVDSYQWVEFNASGFVGLQGIQGATGTAGISATGRIWYFHDSASDISGYEELFPDLPDTMVSDDMASSITNSSGVVTVASYVTDPGDPNITEIPAGEYEFRFWSYVSDATDVTTMWFDVYKRNLAGTETLLFSSSTHEVNDLTATYHALLIVNTNPITVLATDRLVVKVKAQTTSTTAKNVHFVHSGDYPSNIRTAITTGFTGAQGTTGSQGTQGIQGIQGIQGTQGIQGSSGSNGSQGIQGIQGLQGTQGILGTQGFTGSQGTTGSQGATGTQGTQGIQGNGIQGIQGIQGADGGGSSQIQSTVATWLWGPSSANLLSAVTDETGTGSLVFNTSPTLTGTTAAENLSLSGTITGSSNVGALSYGQLAYNDVNQFATFNNALNSYTQVVVQNSSSGATASADFVVANDIATASTRYGDFGINSSGWVGTGAFNTANTVYLTATSSDLAIGTTTANSIRFVVNNGTTDAAVINSSGNATFNGTVTASSFVKSGATGTEFVMGDGTTSSYGRAVADMLGFTSTATAGGTTTLTAASSPYQLFTGSTTQTVVLPDVTTLQQGWTFYIDNDSADGLFVNSSGGNLVINIPYGYSARVTCIATTGTGAGSWDASYNETHSVTSMVITTATKNLTNSTNLQAIFSGTAGLTTGALTVDAATTYEFECSLNITGMSATSGNLGFNVLGGGTATVTSVAWHAIGRDSSTLATASAVGGAFSSTAGQTGNIVTAATGTAVAVLITGIIRINAGGTIIPSIQLTTASAAVLGINSYFKAINIGNNTFQNIGRWA